MCDQHSKFTGWVTDVSGVLAHHVLVVHLLGQSFHVGDVKEEVSSAAESPEGGSVTAVRDTTSCSVVPTGRTRSLLLISSPFPALNVVFCWLRRVGARKETKMLKSDQTVRRFTDDTEFRNWNTWMKHNLNQIKEQNLTINHLMSLHRIYGLMLVCCFEEEAVFPPWWCHSCKTSSCWTVCSCKRRGNRGRSLLNHLIIGIKTWTTIFFYFLNQKNLIQIYTF